MEMSMVQEAWPQGDDLTVLNTHFMRYAVSLKRTK